MKIASCFACIVLATIKTEAGEIFITDDNRQSVELRSTDDVRTTTMSKVTMSADTIVPDTIAADTTSRIVEYPKWNVGTNLLEWVGVMPNLKYTTWAASLNAEAYFAKRYSLRLSAAYSDHDYSGGDKHQGFTSYLVEPRFWFKDDEHFRGFFGGIYGQFGDYNDIDTERKYTGHFWGAGLSAGYLYPIWKGLAIEFNVRAGYRATDINKYVFNEACDRCLRERFSHNKFVLSGFALNLSWRFK